MINRIATCLAPLFVPATRPDRFQKAATSGTDAVIIDLEDAVAPQDKVMARRELTRSALFTVPVMIRINAANTEWFADDVAKARELDVAGIMLPKAESRETVEHLHQLSGGLPVIAIVESARGLAEARNIAPSVSRLAFGSLDYCVDLGCSHEAEALASARSELVLASRLASIAPPLDGVTPSIDDQDAVVTDARRAAVYGFGGKMCIHPSQLRSVMKAFMPSDEEIVWATAIVTQSGAGVSLVAGSMVDAPVLLRAQQILSRVNSK